MKNLVIILFLGLSILACKDDDVSPNPQITQVEIGKDNSKTVKRGTDLHVEAQIYAEDLIEKIEVEIHKEEGKGWEFEKEITKLSGLKNGELHEHFDVPADAALGDYHLHIKVIDKKGKSSKIESEIRITD